MSLMLTAFKFLRPSELSWLEVCFPILIAYGLFALRLLYVFIEEIIKEEYNKWKKKK